jgi:hypothetical protein
MGCERITKEGGAGKRYEYEMRVKEREKANSFDVERGKKGEELRI